MSDLAFWTGAVLLCACALAVVTARSLYRAAYALSGVLLLTAAFYAGLGSPLLATVQILLYTGGVLTLVVYALVVSRGVTEAGPARKPFPAAATAALVFGALASFGRSVPAAIPSAPSPGRELGMLLFQRYLVPFELLSLLLLAALVGALMVARLERAP
ncbi:MAG TPA: NADH-quinone oxidoreductase subunit J [Candidatus Polarisedimenticolaceae bacterium]|nr:NADH-quinone oxidoreductase subunit J [Candidatus Polarisedimenticolaceae bacterium]